MNRFFYGWLIAICGLVILSVSNGLTMQGLTPFDSFLLQEFAWELPSLKFRDFLTFAAAGIMAPLVGSYADRYGTRLVLALGATIMALAFAIYPHVTQMWHVYAIHVLLGLSLACTGIVVVVLLISRWFARHRGTAIGLALVGTSLGNSLFVLLNSKLATLLPWRSCFYIVAAIPLVLIPPILFLIKERPADIGLQIVGINDRAVAERFSTTGGMTFEQALRTRQFWTLTLVSMIVFFVVLGTISNLFLYLQSKNLSLVEAGKYAAMPLLWALFGKFIFGYLCEKIPPYYVLSLNILTMLIGGTLLAFDNLSLFWLTAALFGFGWGGLYTLLQLLMVSSFGPRSAGRILGTMTLLDAIAGGIGPFVMSFMAKNSGSYTSPHLVAAGLLLMAFIISFFVHGEKPVPKLDADLHPQESLCR